MEIWTIINSIASAIGTLVAIIAVIIAYRQIKNINHPKLSSNLSIKQGIYSRNQNENIITALNIDVVNLGISKVYIDHCGISFVNPQTKKVSSGIFSAGSEYENFCLAPGEKKSCPIVIWDIMKEKRIGFYDKEIGIHDKAIIEINLSSGSIIKFDSKKTYLELIDEFERKQ